MSLTPDQKIIALAIDVLVSVNPTLLADNNRSDRASRTLVDPFALARLNAAILRDYPGAIERTREQTRCTVCGDMSWRSHVMCNR